MTKDWHDFKTSHGGIAGAREAFENACATLFNKVYLDRNVKQVAVKQGDGGIDIFIGEIGVEPITVIQCKYFLDEFGEVQYGQIRDSFKTAYESDKYNLKNWILCVPKILDIDQNSWWSKWKAKKLKECSKSGDFITLKDGNELMDLMKAHDLYNQIFKIEDSLRIKDTNEKVTAIYEILSPKKKEIPKNIDPKLALFIHYTEGCEPYYQERNVDIKFIESLLTNNIWVYGKSGVGKTALINRNLTHNKVEYLFCDLSPITINHVDDIFDEIIEQINERYSPQSNDNPNKIKCICSLLNSCHFVNDIVIVIDELSINTIELETAFAEKVLNLVTYYNKQSNNHHLKFVVSTISPPNKILTNKPKAIDYFHYISSDEWADSIEQLFDTLNTVLNLNIREEHKSFILGEMQNSPRLIKNVFKKFCGKKDLSEADIKSLTLQTLREIV